MSTKMIEMLQAIFGMCLLFFLIWAICGVMTAMGVPFWEITFPVAGFIASMIAFKAVGDED